MKIALALLLLASAASAQIPTPAPKSVAKIRVLATCSAADPNMLKPFLSYIEKELGKANVRVVAPVTLGESVTVLGPSTASEVKNFIVLELGEQALLDKVATQLADAKANPQKYANVSVPKSVWALLADFAFDTAGGCELLAPTRLMIVRP